MKKYFFTTFFAFFFAFTGIVEIANAQSRAPIVDLSSDSQRTATRAPVVSGAAQAQADSYYQMQVLQEEVRTLRGLVEELSHEVQQLKQRQMDDYMDVDRRLSALVQGTASGNTTPAVGAAGTAKTLPTTAPPQLTEATPQMTASYTNASNLLLKQRDINAAALAFKQHVVDFPNSPYVPNAWYWLGEIFQLQGQNEEAKKAFTIVVEQYPGHAKAADANFKLGKIYNELGDKEKAKQLLQTAAKSDSPVSTKARDYLRDNF